MGTSDNYPMIIVRDRCGTGCDTGYETSLASGGTQVQVAAQGNPETADRRQNGPGRTNSTSKRARSVGAFPIESVDPLPARGHAL